VLADEPQAFGSAVEASILRTAELSAAMCAFGQTLLTSGRHEDAALVAEILLESDGSSPVARALVRQAALAGAEERWLTGDPDGAVRKLQLLAERLPGDPQSAELLAEAPTTFAMKAVETAVLDGDEFGAHDLFRAAWERATGYPSAKARLKIGAAEFAEKMASTDGVSRLARQIGYFPVVLEAEDEAEFDTPERWEPLLASAGRHRLQQKAQRLRDRLARIQDCDQLLYEEILAALGYKHNAVAFRRLAQRLEITLKSLQSCGQQRRKHPISPRRRLRSLPWLTSPWPTAGSCTGK